MAQPQRIEDIEIPSTGELCFLTKLENDLQHVFDLLYLKFPVGKSCFHVKNLLKKGSLFHKGDFFMSLRSECVLFSDDVKKELIDEVSKIPYIRECQVDEDGNFILSLDRAAIFMEVLDVVMMQGEQYGTKITNKSFLILVHNEVFKSFDVLRIALIANHLISFLVATGAKVYVNEYRKDAELAFKKVASYVCTDICLEHINSICELIEKLAQDSDWTSVTDTTESTILNLKNFVRTQSLCYGGDADTVTIAKNIPNLVVNQSAYIAHFQECHDVHPSHIIHVCSQSQRRKITDAGLLLDMFDILTYPQVFISCQTTIFRDEFEISVDDFMDFQKKEIEKAMNHKFNSCMLAKDTWDVYLNTLIDTTVKFYFLRAGTNVPLKMDVPSGQNDTRNSKDGIFVQYNYARLSNLLSSFELRVKEGYYKSLPPLNEIDFTLLKFEEEWNLLYFVLGFPRLVQEIFSSVMSKHQFSVSRICNMLTKLCSCFSVYYSRIHILGGPQPQLQKVMFARLWLIKGIHQILYNSFVLMNIEGLNKM